MRAIPAGAGGTFTVVVSPEHFANRFEDATLPPVLAIPVTIMAAENAAPDGTEEIGRGTLVRAFRAASAILRPG